MMPSAWHRRILFSTVVDETGICMLITNKHPIDLTPLYSRPFGNSEAAKSTRRKADQRCIMYIISLSCERASA